ncbi:MAG: (d)CMP kinase [Desulfobacterales bacterium]|nr:(d)CMP kinase [Desulfobacterales bacterium]
MNHRIITIDGPAGAGKTTISRMLAQELGCVYVDTGALYRGVAHQIREQGIDWKNADELAPFLEKLDLGFTQNGTRLTVSGRDISDEIRTPEISMLASETSALPMVRQALLDIQRRIADQEDAVFEGRDMGTVVFPNAPFKFFLFADLSIRAQRRFEEMGKTKADLEKVKSDMATRDQNDSQRKEAPLKPAEDAIKVDSTHLSIREVVDTMHKYLKK